MWPNSFNRLVLIDCKSERRLSRTAMDFMIGDITSREVDSQNMPKTPLIERVELPARLHGQVPRNFAAVRQNR